MVLPITPAGAESPVAVLVAAVSPYRELDADYRTFYELLTQQLATAVGGRLDIDARHRDRGRQRLLAVIGSALDRATTAQARREVLVRALVAEGLVDVARLIEIDEDGHQVVHAMAANTAAAQRLLAQIDGTSTLAREVAASGEPRLVEVDDIYLAESSPDPAQQNLRRRLDMRTAILVPLATRGRVVGLLTTARTGTSPAQTTDDLAVLTEIGHRAATALDNALLFERLEVLQRATAALSAAATPVQVAETLVTQFEQLLGTLSVAVFELDESDTLYAMTLRGWNDAVQRDWRSLPLDAPVPVAAAARHRKPVWVERAVDWQRDFPYLLPLAREYGCVSLCCLPLLAGGRCLGVVGFGFSTQRVLDPAERTAVMALVDQGAQALQRAGLLDAESQARRAAEELSQVVGALSGAVTPAEVTRVILEHAAELGASAAVVVLRSGDQLDVLAATAATGDGVFLDGVPLDAAHPLAYATRTGEPVWHGARSERAWRDRSLSSDGDAGLPAQVAVPLLLGSHPIGAVGLHFADGPPVLSAGERAVILTAASQCAQALERARLHQAEREVAEVLQRSLLPRELPGLARLAAAARYLPGVAGVQAGGDWYDLLPIGGTRIAIAVGDVVGQGPLAAAVMGQLRSALACYLLEGHSPAAALERLDRFATHVEGAQCSTCACLTMDWDSGELCWSRAGHLPILLLGTGGPRYLDAGAGTALGVSGRPPYTEARTAIAPGASVLLYTDGLIERRNEVIDDGMDRLARAAAELTDRAPEGFATGLVARVLGDTVPADDIALVVVRFIPEPLRGRLAAEPAALGVLRRAVAHWAATAGLPAAMTEDLQFALGEAAANAVEHAYPDGDGHDNDGAFDYEVSRLASGAIRVRVQDYGTWRSEPADNGFRGHGLKIIRAVADRVEVNGGATGTEVRFLLPAAQPTEAATGWAARSPARSPAGPPGQPATLTMPTPGDSPEARTLQLRGDLDLHGVATVRNALLAELSSPGEVVMDLRQAGYLSSAGVGLLAEAAATSQRRGIQLSVLLTPGSSAARIITLTGLDGSLTVRLDR
jgi:anti-anti-sigma factor